MTFKCSSTLAFLEKKFTLNSYYYFRETFQFEMNYNEQSSNKILFETFILYSDSNSQIFTFKVKFYYKKHYTPYPYETRFTRLVTQKVKKKNRRPIDDHTLVRLPRDAVVVLPSRQHTYFREVVGAKGQDRHGSLGRIEVVPVMMVGNSSGGADASDDQASDEDEESANRQLDPSHLRLLAAYSSFVLSFESGNYGIDKMPE